MFLRRGADNLRQVYGIWCLIVIDDDLQRQFMEGSIVSCMFFITVSLVAVKATNSVLNHMADCYVKSHVK